ncbi:MAG: carbohydrate ABC transporter permease [Acutalibacteraceae bacterium]
MDLRRTRRRSVIERYNRTGYIFILPWVIGFAVLLLQPLIQTVQFSFSEVDITASGYTTDAVGWEHFFYAFREDASFPKLLANSVVSMLTDVPILLIFSFFAAVLLRKNFRGCRVVKGIFFITVLMSSGVCIQMQNETIAANTVQLSAAMNSAAGAASSLKSIDIGKYLVDAGISEEIVAYLAAPVEALFSVMTRSGIQIFIFLAGLSSISPALYEACSIEGATGWETFWMITFPMTSPLIVVNLIYSIVDSFMANDNQALQYIYRQAFDKLNYGYASALSWIYFAAVGLIIALATLVISKRVVYHT